MKKTVSKSKAKEILRDGTAQGHALTDKQKRYFGWIAGGKKKKAKGGASITALSSDNPMSNGIFRFDGPSHENGGIDITYANQGVEVEGDETGYIDLAGDLNVFGNMKIPGTSVKFKDFAKKVAKKETKATKKLNKSVDLVNENDPYDPFERLSFNAGVLMGKAAENELSSLSLVKEATAGLQSYMLDNEMDKYYGENPKARHGAIIAQNGFNSNGDEPWWLKAMRDPRSVQGSPFLTPRPALTTAATPAPAGMTPASPTFNEVYEEVTQEEPKKKGRQSLAQRHNNPGNIMYSPKATYQKKLGAVPGEARYDSSGKLIGHFAKFPSIEAGIQGMKNQLFDAPSYKKLTVDQAARRWVYGSENAPTPGYGSIPSDLAGKKIADLTPAEQKRVFDVFTIGEDSKKYNWNTPNTPTTVNPVPGADPNNPPITTSVSGRPVPVGPGTGLPRPDQPVPTTKKPPVEYTGPVYPQRELPPIEIPESTPHEPFRNPLRFSQIAPELVTLATEEAEFVPGLRYEPQLYQPYQVSFQDQLNENEATFRALSQQLPGNPAALATLAGQKYRADSQVLSEQFRTNQGIENEIINKNIALMNDAQMRNLGLLDQQIVRQAQARSNTRENVRNALSSISSKFDQNRLETLNYNVASNLFPNYTFDRYGRREYQVADVPEFTGGYNPNTASDDYYQRTRTEYDSTGNVRRTVVNEPSEAEKAKIDHQNRLNSLKEREDSSLFKRLMQGMTRPRVRR